jgi:hypothetical protein
MKTFKPAGTGWIKMPSVTLGGKPHFWTRLNTLGQRQWCVWNRSTRKWGYSFGGNIS